MNHCEKAVHGKLFCVSCPYFGNINCIFQKNSRAVTVTRFFVFGRIFVIFEEK